MGKSDSQGEGHCSCSEVSNGNATTRVNTSILNLRVTDIWACYKQWGDKGAFFLSEALDNHGWEWRCYMRDPDGYLIEVGQYTQLALDHFKRYAG